MLKIDTIIEKLTALAANFELEVKEVYNVVVIPNWKSDRLHGFPQTLYGYMMAFFARIDLLSTYWRGDSSSNQTTRMIKFMDKYISSIWLTI